MTAAQYHSAPLSKVRVQGYPITLGLLKTASGPLSTVHVILGQASKSLHSRSPITLGILIQLFFDDQQQYEQCNAVAFQHCPMPSSNQRNNNHDVTPPATLSTTLFPWCCLGHAFHDAFRDYFSVTTLHRCRFPWRLSMTLHASQFPDAFRDNFSVTLSRWWFPWRLSMTLHSCCFPWHYPWRLFHDIPKVLHSAIFVWLMASALRPPHSLSWHPLLSDGKMVTVSGWRCVCVMLWVTLCGWRCVTGYVTPENYGGYFAVAFYNAFLMEGQFEFSHKHYAILYLHLELVGRHQTERVPAPHQLDFHVNFIQQIAILKEHVGVYATHSVTDRQTDRQTTLLGL